MFAEECHLLCHLLLLCFLLRAELLLNSFALFAHLLLLRLLQGLYLLAECFLLVVHLLSQHVTFLLLLLFGRNDTFLCSQHLRTHGIEDGYATDGKSDKEKE